MADRPKLIVSWHVNDGSSQQGGLVAVSGWSGVVSNSLFRAEIDSTPLDGSWVIKFTSRTDRRLQGNLDVVLAGELAFSSPCRLVMTTGEAAGRVIAKDGGVEIGNRIDSAFPQAPIRDAIALDMEPRGLMIWTAKVEPCGPADFNGDGAVDSRDQAILLGSWGTTDLIPDLDKSGIVDANDLGIFGGYWSG